MREKHAHGKSEQHAQVGDSGYSPPRREHPVAPLHPPQAQISRRGTSAPSRGNTSRTLDAVIFLDIDGVVHSLYGQDIFKESCLVLLEKIVLGTGASIVLSSTWRTQAKSYAMVNTMLRQRRLPEIVDRTRDLSAEMHRYIPREVEICEWLDRHPEVTRWIAIDDMDLQSDSTEWAHRLRGHFVHTNPNTGLIPADAELALRLISPRRLNPGPPTGEQMPSAAAPISRQRSVPCRTSEPRAERSSTHRQHKEQRSKGMPIELIANVQIGP